MEPLAYLQIVKRRWWIIVGLVVVAVLLVYVMTPARFTDHYEATHVLLVEGDRDSSDSGAANPEVVALWAKEDEVLAEAAAQLGLGVDTQRLSRNVRVATDRAVDTVSITAEDRNPDFAAQMANTVAEQTVVFLVAREEASQRAEDEELAARDAELRTRIRELDAAIDRNPLDVETLTAERDALIRQLGDVLEARDVDIAPVNYTSVEVPERGSKQERPFGTRTREQRMVLAGLVAAVLGFGLAIMLDRSDTRLRTRRGAEEHFGLPVIAEIVAFPLWSRHRRQAVTRQPDSAVAESFRTLRSALMLLAPVEGARRRSRPGDAPPSNGDRSHSLADVIMITSAGTDDGKTTTVSNLAAAYGESGQSVVVLSFDLKRARMGRRSKDRRQPGVSDYLAASSPPPLETLVQDTVVPGVRVVNSGGATRPPGGQFASQQHLLDEARSLADVVILDTAPLLSSSIGRELATMVDRVVLLCRVGRTTVGEAERCGDLLAQIGAPALGVVLVGVTAPSASEYFGYFNLRRDRRIVAAEKASADEAAGETVATDEVAVEAAGPSENGPQPQPKAPVAPAARDVPADG
jgi:Mrp family chromosome partitioning ATPase/capsular polysaccharide biosynthesis protein